jgi:hypothetical protein
MNLMNKRTLKKVAWLGLLIGCFWPLSAGAYILRGPHVLDLMARELRYPQQLLVHQRQFLFDTNEEGRIVELVEVVRYLLPGSFRSDIETETVQRTHVNVRGQDLTVMDGQIVESGTTRFDRYKDIFLYQRRQDIETHLTALGIDIGVTSLGRLDDRVAYVLGAQYPDNRPTQIWVEKDTFRPLRWMQATQTSDGQLDLFEIRYHDWRPVGKAWYPGRIDFYHNAALIREIIIEGIQKDTNFDGALFDLERLRAKYPTAPQVLEAPTESEELREVHETIEEFKKKFE